MSGDAGPQGPSWPPQVEGAISAHRRILELLLAGLALARGDGGRLLDELEDRLGYRDAHEDPGVEPDLAFSIEKSADDEIARLMRAARDIVAAAGQTPSGRG